VSPRIKSKENHWFAGDGYLGLTTPAFTMPPHPRLGNGGRSRLFRRRAAQRHPRGASDELGALTPNLASTRAEAPTEQRDGL
jgi:hypothetical protein